MPINKALTTTCVFLSSFFISSVWAQNPSTDPKAAQLAKTPDGQVLLITTNENGQTVVQNVELLSSEAKNSLPNKPTGEPSVAEADAPASIATPPGTFILKAEQLQVLPNINPPNATVNNTSAPQSYTLVPNPQNPNTFLLKPVTQTPTQVSVPAQIANTLSNQPEPIEPALPAPTPEEKPEQTSSVQTPLLETALLSDGKGYKDSKSLWENDGGGLTLQFSQLNIAFNAANREGIDEKADAVGLGFEYYFPKSSLFFSLGFNLIGFDDIDPLTVDVFNSRGNRIQVDSSARGATTFFELGQKFSFANDGHYLSLRVGHEEFVLSERFIRRCINCREENIDLDAGAYGAIAFGSRVLKYPQGGGLYLEFNHKRYESNSDLEEANGIQLSWVF